MRLRSLSAAPRSARCNTAVKYPFFILSDRDSSEYSLLRDERSSMTFNEEGVEEEVLEC